MRMELAKAFYHPMLLCPLCEHLESANEENKMIDHLVNVHTDEEAKELLGWEE